MYIFSAYLLKRSHSRMGQWSTRTNSKRHLDSKSPLWLLKQLHNYSYH